MSATMAISRARARIGSRPPGLSAGLVAGWQRRGRKTTIQVDPGGSKWIQGARSHDLRLQAGRQGAQLGQEDAAHGAERAALAAHANVDRGDDPAVDAPQRHRDRAEADLGLLVDQREAVGARLEDRLAQLLLAD